ncbi:MAG: glycosyltransferase family 2 protein [Betaproteobacteria bacterium]
MSPQRRVAAVIPAYNEVRTLRAVVSGVLAEIGLVIVVDDGSTDGTVDVIRDLPVSLIRHEKNLGKSRSLADGFHAALISGAEVVVTLDGDGQHRSQDIPALLAESEQHPACLIIGARLHEKANIPSARYRANRFANFWIAWAAGYQISDSQSGFRVYPATMLEELLPLIEKRPGFVLESEILILAGWRNIHSRPVPIPAIYPVTNRPSHFRPVRDITLITLMVARHLLMRGLYGCGLISSLRGSGSTKSGQQSELQIRKNHNARIHQHK